jgi:hypothetical protein
MQTAQPDKKPDRDFAESHIPSEPVDDASAKTLEMPGGVFEVDLPATDLTAITQVETPVPAAPDAINASETTAPATTPVPAPRTLYDIAWLDALPVAWLPNDREYGVGPITPINKIKHPVYVFAEAGAGAVLPAKNVYKTGVKLHAGAGLGYLVHPRLHAMLSGGYLVQDGGFDFERTSTITSFGFAARSQNNSLKPDRLHYLYSKLGLVYRIHRHSIAASGGLQWLYGAQGDITTYTTGTFESANPVTRRAWLSLNGLNRMQWNASLQYGYRVAPRIHLAAGTQYYFNSLIAQDAELDAQGYDWGGKTAKWQPFFTINYLLYGPL